MGIGNKLNQISAAQQSGVSQQASTVQQNGQAQPQQHYGQAQPQQPYKQAQPQQHYGQAQQQQPYGQAQPQQPYGQAQPQQHYGQTQYRQAPPPNSYSQNTAHTPISGQPPRYMVPGSGQYYSAVYQMLSNLVRVKRWEQFYPPQRLEHLARKIGSLDFRQITSQYGLASEEIALELAKISLVDVVLYCDDSGSMIFSDNGERWNNDLQAIIKMTSELTTIFDTDGVDVYFMNNQTSKTNITRAEEVQQLISTVQPGGVTPLGVELEKKLLMPYAHHLSQSRSMTGGLTNCKPILIICITDGSPTDNPRDYTKTAINKMIGWLRQNGLSGSEVGYQFAQVGRDTSAQRFLDEMDNDPMIGDYVDATSYYEFEEQQWAVKAVKLTPYLYILKMLLGGFDPEWDNKD